MTLIIHVLSILLIATGTSQAAPHLRAVGGKAEEHISRQQVASTSNRRLKAQQHVQAHAPSLQAVGRNSLGSTRSSVTTYKAPASQYVVFYSMVTYAVARDTCIYNSMELAGDDRRIATIVADLCADDGCWLMGCSGCSFVQNTEVQQGPCDVLRKFVCVVRSPEPAPLDNPQTTPSSSTPSSDHPTGTADASALAGAGHGIHQAEADQLYEYDYVDTENAGGDTPASAYLPEDDYELYDYTYATLTKHTEANYIQDYDDYADAFSHVVDETPPWVDEGKPQPTSNPARQPAAAVHAAQATTNTVHIATNSKVTKAAAPRAGTVRRCTQASSNGHLLRGGDVIEIFPVSELQGDTYYYDYDYPSDMPPTGEDIPASDIPATGTDATDAIPATLMLLKELLRTSPTLDNEQFYYDDDYVYYDSDSVDNALFKQRQAAAEQQQLREMAERAGALAWYETLAVALGLLQPRSTDATQLASTTTGSTDREEDVLTNEHLEMLDLLKESYSYDWYYDYQQDQQDNEEFPDSLPVVFQDDGIERNGVAATEGAEAWYSSLAAALGFTAPAAQPAKDNHLATRGGNKVSTSTARRHSRSASRRLLADRSFIIGQERLRPETAVGQEVADSEEEAGDVAGLEGGRYFNDARPAWRGGVEEVVHAGEAVKQKADAQPADQPELTRRVLKATRRARARQARAAQRKAKQVQ